MHDDHAPECSTIVEKLCQHATEQDAQADAQVPCREQGRVGCASLVVVCHTDNHVLDGWPHVTITQSDEQCRAIITPHAVGDGKERISDRRDEYALAGITDEASFAQRGGSLQTGEDKT